MIRDIFRIWGERFDAWIRGLFMGDVPAVPEAVDTRSEWDAHVDDALALVSPWNDGDRATARALGIAL